MADWFKFYENGLDEMRLQWAIKEQPGVLSVWIVILSEACRHKSGTLSWSMEDWQLFALSNRINYTVPVVNQCLNLLEKIGYIEIKEKHLSIHKWNDLQSEYCYKKTKKTDIVPTVSRHTQDNVVLEERRGEENRGDKKINTESEFSKEDIEINEKINRSRPKPVLFNNPFRSKFRELWSLEYKAFFSKEYHWKDARDDKAIDSLMGANNVNPEEYIKVAVKAWALKDGQKHFWCKKSITVQGFIDRYQEILQETGMLKVEKKKEAGW